MIAAVNQYVLQPEITPMTTLSILELIGALQEIGRGDDLFNSFCVLFSLMMRRFE
jgi:hypothetical protein